ncbi:MAG: hypothetical protein ACKO2L_03560 [Planctomycetaceae bacterium]
MGPFVKLVDGLEVRRTVAEAVARQPAVQTRSRLGSQFPLAPISPIISVLNDT